MRLESESRGQFDRFTLGWLEAFGVVQDERERRRMVRTAPGELARLGFGQGEPQRVQLCADLIGWLFLFDDRFADGALRYRPAELAAIHARLERILRLEPVQPVDPIEACLKDLFERFAREAPEHWVRRLGESVRLYFQGCELETRCRADGAQCSLDAYLEIRLLSVGVYPMLDLCELAQGAFVSPLEVASAPVARLRRLATLSTAMTNDLYSAKKEALEDASFNAVLVAARHEGLSFQQAFERITALQADFHRQVAALESGLRAAGCSPEVGAFVAGAWRWMEGNRQWSAACARYNQLELVPALPGLVATPAPSAPRARPSAPGPRRSAPPAPRRSAPSPRASAPAA